MFYYYKDNQYVGCGNEPTAPAGCEARETPPAPPEPDPAAIEAQRIASLWQAAYNYEFAQISGMAVGVLTIGVLQQKPKALAISAWSKSIWDAYYTRKTSGSTDTDYSFAGPMPHSVPELMTEVLG